MPASSPAQPKKEAPVELSVSPIKGGKALLRVKAKGKEYAILMAEVGK